MVLYDREANSSHYRHRLFNRRSSTMVQGKHTQRHDLGRLCVRPGRALDEPTVMTNRVLEDYGVCSKTGIILNPFGQKPEWVLQKADKLVDKHRLNKAQEALL